jgi:hypothetical protein
MASKLIAFPFFLDMGSSLVRGGKLKVLGSGFKCSGLQSFGVSEQPWALNPEAGKPRNPETQTYPDKTLNGEP